jgi:nucleoside-diphosphate-sugar epimerase
VTVLVTGGSGLVGSHVLEMLRGRGEPVRALVRSDSRPAVEALGAEPVIGDVTDADAWRRASSGVRAIVHAAALVAPRARFEEFDRVNVGGTRLATQTARTVGARLIYVSTVAVYGRSEAYAAGHGAVAEDFPFQPLPERDFYARTKRMADVLVQEMAARGGLSATLIRPNVIYGERDRLFTPRVIATLRRGFVPQIGHGMNHLSCVYAGNVASAIVAALDAPIKEGYRAYNVTQDAPPLLTQGEFFAAFAEVLGVRPRRLRIPISLAHIGVGLWGAVQRVVGPRRYAGLAGSAVSFVVGDNPYVTRRVRAELGWTPPFDPRSAIRRTVARL